uniref:PABS domain-containing protein n=1 Tax=Meloidogyne incognita TaxID=6306 RepID=A0A914NSF6_MELIC
MKIFRLVRSSLCMFLFKLMMKIKTSLFTKLYARKALKKIVLKLRMSVLKDGTAMNEYERLLVVDKVEDVVLTIAKLIPKPGEKFSAKNSAGWPVMKKRLILAYIKAIAGQLLATGCLESSKETPRILMLGLGGGTVPNFFDEVEGNREFISIDLEPAMEYISRKWFNLKNTPNQKVIIQDALEYINNWKIEGIINFGLWRS